MRQITSHNTVLLWKEHLLRGVSAEAVSLEGFDSDGHRWFAVNSVGGAAHRTELSTPESVVDIQLISVDVKLDVAVSQIAPHSDVDRFTILVLYHAIFSNKIFEAQLTYTGRVTVVQSVEQYN